MAPADAYAAGLNLVYLPIFFEKVAQVCGFVPRTDQERQMLLDMAVKEEDLMDGEAKKQAAVRPELAEAARGLGLGLDPMAQVKQAVLDRALSDEALVDGLYALASQAA